MTDNALYLEADEDITSAIDKLTKSQASTIQIVVPKRSTMLQSIINLKLLKKAAEKAGKELVLVTNDKVASDLAGRVGLAVAPSIGANAVVQHQEIPEDLKSNEEIIDDSDPEPTPPATEPVVAKVKSSIPSRPFRHKEITDDPPPEPKADESPKDDAPAQAKTNKPLKVPNWGRLQKRVMWLSGLVVLVVAYFVFMYFGSSASVTLMANGNKTDIATSFTVDPTASSSNSSKGVLSGQLVSVSKNLSGNFTPTGQQDAGTKASGTVTIQNCSDPNSYTLNAGNTLTSQSLSFVTQQNITIPGGTFTISHGQIVGCTSQTVTDTVEAAANGDQYNLTNASFTSSKLPSGINITGSMSGGTTKTITVVTQNDVTTEENALLASDKNNESSALSGKVPSGDTAISASQSSTVSAVNPSPAIGAQGTSATLSISVTYSELMVKNTDYKSLVDAQETQQVGSGNEIYDDGLSSAQITQSQTNQNGSQTFQLTTTAYSGAKLNTTQLAKQLAGMRFSSASDYATGLPDISQANISLWPSWSTNLPSRPGSIHIHIQVLNK
jgi:hypothetical protein